jgi:hypothetical protein
VRMRKRDHPLVEEKAVDRRELAEPVAGVHGMKMICSRPPGYVPTP